jgi:hypothetical protein
MPDELKHEPTRGRAGAKAPGAVTPDDPVPAPDDPGGARAKGYTAEPGPAPAVEDGAVPLAPAPEESPAIHVPERDQHVRPTGRNEPGKWPPRERATGAGR